MLELLTGIEAVRRVTSEKVATEPAPRRPPRPRRRSAAAVRHAVSAAIVALGGALSGRPHSPASRGGSLRRAARRRPSGIPR